MADSKAPHPKLPIEIEPDPVIEAFKKDVDRTLLRRNLALTVEERFNNHSALLEFVEELRRAGRAARQAKTSQK